MVGGPMPEAPRGGRRGVRSCHAKEDDVGGLAGSGAGRGVQPTRAGGGHPARARQGTKGGVRSGGRGWAATMGRPTRIVPLLI
jgi:hypothetical protein